jgi:hypothetical protein
VSILELEELAGIPDTLPYCPVKEAEMALEFPVLPIVPDLVESVKAMLLLHPRRSGNYRVCGIGQLVRK